MLTAQYGILGTAIAAALRNTLDAVAVLLLARRGVAKGEFAWRSAFLPGLASAGLVAVALWSSTMLQSFLVLTSGLSAFLLMAWFVLLLPAERARLKELSRAACAPKVPVNAPSV